MTVVEEEEEAAVGINRNSLFIRKYRCAWADGGPVRRCRRDPRKSMIYMLIRIDNHLSSDVWLRRQAHARASAYTPGMARVTNIVSSRNVVDCRM